MRVSTSSQFARCSQEVTVLCKVRTIFALSAEHYYGTDHRCGWTRALFVALCCRIGQVRAACDGTIREHALQTGHNEWFVRLTSRLN